MKMTVTFAGLFFFLTALLFTPAIQAMEEKNIADWKILKEKNGTLFLSLKVAENGYIYASQLQIKIFSAKNKLLPAKQLFKTKKVQDPFSGEKTDVLEGNDPFYWRLDPAGSDYPLSGNITFQGCWKGGNGKEAICLFPVDFPVAISNDPFESMVLYPTNEKKIIKAEENKTSLSLPSFTILRSFAGSTSEKVFLHFLKGKGENISAGEKSFLEGKSIFLVIFLTLLGGFLLNLTPCILPMIPLNLAVIGASRKNTSRWEKILRGLLYGSGIASAYGVLGVICILTGSSMGALDSSWYFNLGVSIVMILLGLSLFDLYVIDLTRLGNRFGRPDSARFTGVFLLGVMTSILAGACVAPVVAAVLIYSSKLYSEGSIAALFLPFVLGAGMALPWPIAAGGLSILPKPGKWMVRVKYLFGIFIIVLGLSYGYQAYRILDHLHIRKNPSSGSVKKLLSSMETARKENKPLFAAFGAVWCKNCTIMKKGVLQKDSVKKALEGYVTIEFDASDVTDKNIDRVLKSMNVKGLPTYVILKVSEK